MFELTVLALSSALNLLLGLVVFLKNTRSITNRLFFMMTFSFAAWSVVNYISVHPAIFSQIVWVRLVMFFAALLSLSVFLTFEAFPNYSVRVSSRARKLAIYYTAFVMLLTQTPLVFKALKVVGNNAQPQPGPGIVLFVILVIGLLGGGVYHLVHKYKRSFGIERVQIRFVLLGLAGTFGLILITDFFLVIIFKYSKLVPLGPAYTLIFSSSLAYAILKHRLFDIRAAVARSVAYVLAIGCIGLIYAVGLFGIINAAFPGSNHEMTRQLLSIAMIMPLVFSFQLIRRYFDSLTNKIFYRNAYDNQEVLDQLGSLIVAEISLAKILAGTRLVLEKSLKSSMIEFILIEHNQAKLVSNRSVENNPHLSQLIHHIRSQHSEIVVTDELGQNNPLKKILSESGVAVSLRLKNQSRVVGFILFGNKRGGDIYSTPDLKLMAIVADELAIAIQNALSFEAIQEFNVTLQEKIDQATKQLRNANQRLKELDSTKDEFISMASHQLRTPLTSIKGYLSMVLEGDAGKVPKKEKEMIQTAFDSAERMVYLIADLLNVSRLQSGKFVIENKPTDLAKMVSATVNQLQETAKNHHLTLTYDPPAKFPIINIDETKIQQVVMNFMDNAIYYTPAGGSIDVKLELTDNEIRYTVTDTGLGVPVAEQHHLFSKFYRAGNARKMRPDGTGLGLFMAKKVIVAQGGAIIFKSTEGKGSTFGFSLPKSKLEAKAAAPEKPKAEPVTA